MSERNYYCICDDDCRFPTMTSEQILAAIAEATGNTVDSVDSAFITKIRDQNKNTDLKVWVGSQAEYNALEEYESNILYLIWDDTSDDTYIEMQKTLNGTPQMNKVLFEGTLEAGTNLNVNVDGISNYTMLLIEAGNRPIICGRAGNKISGQAPYFPTPTTRADTMAQLTLSGDKITAYYGAVISFLNDNTLICNFDTAPTISKITGLM